MSERLRCSSPLYGLVVKMPAVGLVELAGYVGFDLVMLDTEHGIADGAEIEHHLRAADAANIECLVRVGGHHPTEIARALDAGATGVVVPHVTSADDARIVARAAHYPPGGTRGLAVSTRAGRQGTVALNDHLAVARKKTVVVVQVEDGEAMSQIDAIANTPMVDSVFIGPTDLSLSLGHPGDYQHPVVAGAIDDLAEAILARSAAAVCVVVDSVEAAVEWDRRGASMILFTASGLFAACL